MANTDLKAAKDAKNDEFYTQLSDIQAELSHYSDKFRGKVVFCNCDDPFESNFVKYFLMNFNRLGLKELIATGYKTSPILGDEIGTKGHPYVLRVTDTSKYLVGTQSDLDPRGAKYFLDTEANNLMQPIIGNAAIDENGNPIMTIVKVPVIDEDGNPVLDKKGKSKTKIEKQPLYYEAGDFRSNMSVELLKQSDIVCTNPPFSLFREYVAQLMEYGKQFLVIGNMGAASYKEIFPLVKYNKIWTGQSISSGDRKFNVPDNYPLHAAGCGIENGRKFIRVKGVRWFTNLDYPERHQVLPIDLGCKYCGYEDTYPTYDNYNAIDVDTTNLIPCDYTGVMGVPISFLDKYCPEQFELIGIGSGQLAASIGVAKNYRGRTDIAYTINGVSKCPYTRILIRYTTEYITAHPEQFESEE